MSEKRELVLKALRGESVDRVPVGFWHHFTTEDEWLHGFENPETVSYTHLTLPTNSRV